MPVRGVRGATTITADCPEEILHATIDLIEKIIENNAGLLKEDVASVIFTTTNDIRSEFPAKAVRQMGWDLVPLMCMQEIPVPDSLHRCIRVLLHWNTDKKQRDIGHIYLNEAKNLRPDLEERVI
ncbi:MAG: chorismate mutase [Anaerolineaceae bacterium]|nr:chorismate mutase [Anaerolineaceae bacterium]